jgi:hypothetical protein
LYKREMTPVNDPLSMFSARLNLLQYRYTFLEFVLSKHLKRLDALSEVIMDDKVEPKYVDDTNRRVLIMMILLAMKEEKRTQHQDSWGR